jgi:hypothetical protein
MLVALGDVVLGQALQRGHRVGHAGRRHAPGADGGAQQVHRVATARQPVPEQELVQRAQDQALGATGGARHHPHLGRRERALAQACQRGRAGQDAQGLHRHARRRFSA